MAKVIGIDLGTTNSCVAVMEGKEGRVIENSEENIKNLEHMLKQLILIYLLLNFISHSFSFFSL